MSVLDTLVTPWRERRCKERDGDHEWVARSTATPDVLFQSICG